MKSLEGDFYECRIKGRFRTHGIKSTNPVAVGDHVVFELEDHGDGPVGTISEILERRNYIIRRSVKLSKQTHIIAANLDQVFLLVTLVNPLTSTTFIDRFLVTARAYDIPAVLLFNKMDTYGKEELAELYYLSDLYTGIGYPCIQLEASTGRNVEKVRTLMKDRTSMFSGHSGVGKSTLINALEPGLELKTAELSKMHQQGQHTTTFAEMYDLSFGARIVDTPGIKGFGVVDMEADEIGDYFPEFFALKSSCKFNNCLHLDEPQCAVKLALERDELAWSRYRSYVQLLSGEDEGYRTDIYGQ